MNLKQALSLFENDRYLVFPSIKKTNFSEFTSIYALIPMVLLTLTCLYCSSTVIGGCELVYYFTLGVILVMILVLFLMSFFSKPIISNEKKIIIFKRFHAEPSFKEPLKVCKKRGDLKKESKKTFYVMLIYRRWQKFLLKKETELKNKN